MTSGCAIRPTVTSIALTLMSGLTLGLAACGTAPSANEAAVANETGPSSPAFGATTEQALAGIVALGEPWASAKKREPMRDAKTGGLVDVLDSRDGSAQVFSRSDGKVWQVRLVTGAPNNCGTSGPLIAALPKIAALLKPGFAFAEADKFALGDGMSALRPVTKTADGVKATVVGGCTHWLTLAVPDDVATPTG